MYVCNLYTFITSCRFFFALLTLLLFVFLRIGACKKHAKARAAAPRVAFALLYLLYYF